ncbi:AI-2E family transporter [Candidatus Fokinia crypta]|uniref:PerM-like transporter n=1 Tax=Candidatus Fokinia crypta TaxID=1920990 RepID=A0ABZ0UQZ2_9RICK|nr:AI-2E family transporter [Candidatus Fokinia cryptica]WPX97666.1 Putative PerM-like transporter [Candidatus Fokinia cryptica]
MKNKQKENVYLIIAILIICVGLVNDITKPFVYGGILGYIILPFYLSLARRLRSKSTAALISATLGTVIILFFWSVIIWGIMTGISIIHNALTSKDIHFTSYLGDIKSIIENAIMDNVHFDKVVSNLNIGHYTKFIYDIFQISWVNAMSFGLFISIVPFTSYYVMKEANTYKLLTLKLFSPEKITLLEKIGSNGRMILIRYLALYTLLSLIHGSITYTTLIIFDVSNALKLSIIAAISNYIPYIGGILTYSCIFIVATAKFGIGSEILGLALFFVGYSILNFIFLRNIVGMKLDLHPIITVFSVLIFAKCGNIVGILLAIPLASFLLMLFRELTYTQDRNLDF